MNDMNKKSSAIFTPSGCLTGDALLLFVNGKLPDLDRALAHQHIDDCPLCNDAAEGLGMWLKETKPGDASVHEANDIQENDFPGASAKSNIHPDKSTGRMNTEFFTRTTAINDRIKQRLHSHALLKVTESRRLSYKPFVWLSAAASIVLFLGGFYVIWIQNQIDNEKLANERSQELALIESTSKFDTVTISLPVSGRVLALNEKKNKGSLLSVQSEEIDVPDDSEIFNHDNHDNTVTEISVLPESRAEEIAVVKEGTKTIQADEGYQGAAAKSAGTAMKKAEMEEDSRSVFTIVEHMPEFPGGESERIKFLAENIVYPVQASENGIQGSVFVSFIVKKDGHVSDIRIIKGIGGGCDEEALRVIKLMPPWRPGSQRGKNVDVQYTMPVSFKLSH